MASSIFKKYLKVHIKRKGSKRDAERPRSQRGKLETHVIMEMMGEMKCEFQELLS